MFSPQDHRVEHQPSLTYDVCVHCASSVYLDGVVEGLEDADALGAQLQVHQPLHAQEDAVVLQRLLTRQHDDAGHRLLHTQQL